MAHMAHMSHGMAHMKPSVCLNMIVRDEASIIKRCLGSVVDHIDSYAIVDTGSTDATPTIIGWYMASHGIPGLVVSHQWLDFATARNEALDLARGISSSKYLLFLDADEVVSAWPYAWPDSFDWYSVRHESACGTYAFPRESVVVASRDWRWELPVHERLVQVGEPTSPGVLPGMTITYHQDGARARERRRFERDAELLEAYLVDNPGHAGAVYYAAQSWHDAWILSGKDEHAANAMRQYQRRLGMPWDVWESVRSTNGMASLVQALATR